MAANPTKLRLWNLFKWKTEMHCIFDQFKCKESPHIPICFVVAQAFVVYCLRMENEEQVNQYRELIARTTLPKEPIPSERLELIITL